MSRRAKSNGRTSDRQLRAEDSSDDLRRYQECAKKLDECSKNLLRLCQVPGELHDDDIERAANEIIRNEEEEAKKIAAELLHQKGLLHRNIQEPEVSASSYLNQEDCGSRPRSGGTPKSNAASVNRRLDYEVPKTQKSQQEQFASDQRSNVHQQIISQPPYQILHCEERVPCQPCPSQQYTNSGARPNPCTDYSASQLKVPTASSSPYVTKGDGTERKGPPYFRQAQQQPAQSTWGRPEPVWNATVNRKVDSSGLSNPRLVDQCAEQVRKMNEMTQSSMAEPAKRGTKPQTIHLTAGAGRMADPPVHIVITAIANDSKCEHAYQQPNSYARDPLYSDNEFAEESVYSLGNKGTSTIYSAPNGDDRVPPKCLGSQQKLVERGSDAYVCPDDVTRILNCAIKYWERTKNSLRAKSVQQTNSCRDLQYETSYGRHGQTPFPNQTESSSLHFPLKNRNAEGVSTQQKPSVGYSRSCPDGPAKGRCRDRTGVGNSDQGTVGVKRDVTLICQNVPQVNSRTAQSRPTTCNPATMMDALRQYRTQTAPSVCRDRKNELNQFSSIPNDFGSTLSPRGKEHQLGTKPRVPGPAVPKTYQCTQICPPMPSPVQCAPTVHRTQSRSRMKPTASEMDSSILLAIAKAAINLSLEKQQEECEETEYDDDCDSGYPDVLDTVFDE